LSIELCGDILRSRPKETDGIENVIVVDGLPVVGEDRLEKLKGVVRKIFSKFGAVNSEFFASDLPEGQNTS
jgi:translation initiation factor 3 subunit B